MAMAELAATVVATGKKDELLAVASANSMHELYEVWQRVRQLEDAEIPPVTLEGGTELVRAWAKDDADTVAKSRHTRGRQAEIRLNFIKGFRGLTMEQKKSLYEYYVRLLNQEIAELDGGKSYGSVPSFN